MYISRGTPSLRAYSLLSLALAEHKTCAPRATNQICGAPRATDAQIRYNLCLRDQSRSIFERLLILHPKTIFSHILFQCDFRTILTLRRVSKKINELVLTINTSNPHSPLGGKAIIFFYYPYIYPNTESEVQKKFNFAQQFTKVDFAISIQDLLHSPLTVSSIPENRLSFTIIIKNLDDIFVLNSLIRNQPSSPLYDKIRGFDFSDLKITPLNTDSILSLLTSAIQNRNLCSNLKTLSFGDILNGATLVLPKELPNLERLSFKDINYNCELDLSNYSFPNLISLSFGHINQYAELILPDSLHIKELYFGSVYKKDTLILPSKLHNLETLHFTAIHGKVDLSNCFCPNLKSLSLCFIWTNATLILHLHQFPNLKHFEIEIDQRDLSDRLPLFFLKLELAMKCLM